MRQRKQAQYPNNWPEIARQVKAAAGWQCEVCGTAHGPVPAVLTVHHLDFDPRNCTAGNLIALCQRCHLAAQGRRPVPMTREELIRRLRPQGKQGRLAM